VDTRHICFLYYFFSNIPKLNLKLIQFYKFSDILSRPIAKHNAKIQKKLPKALAIHFLKRNLQIPDELEKDDTEELLKLKNYLN
jgi:hypothetical protein